MNQYTGPIDAYLRSMGINMSAVDIAGWVGVVVLGYIAFRLVTGMARAAGFDEGHRIGLREKNEAVSEAYDQGVEAGRGLESRVGDHNRSTTRESRPPRGSGNIDIQ